jgi:hypothetical protein
MTADERKQLRALLECTTIRDIDLDQEIMEDWADVDREWMATFDEPVEAEDDR